MWWVVLVALSYLDRELAVGSGVGPPSRGRLSEECGGPRGSRPFTPRMDEPKRRGSEVTRRAKRGFTYPGTLWCGAGNMADHYDQLGEFEETDSCCRTHDHCPHVIHAFSSKYGYTNFKWHSICHCDCDQALKACLHRVNDTSSRVMGQAFFNVIAAPCFQLLYEERCAERHWYGPCKRYEKLPVAVVKEAVPYEYGAADIGSPERKTDHEKEESATPAAPSGPGAPSLPAVENFIEALATIVSSTSAAQTSHNKRKKKKDRGQKTKKATGQRSKRKKGAAATLPLTKSINDVITGEAAPETAQLRPTGRPSAHPPKKRRARTGSGGLKVAPASPEQAPRPAGYNLTAGLTWHPKRRPSEEIPQPPVHLKSPARSPSKKRLTRKEEVVVTLPKEPVQPTVADGHSQHQHPGEKIFASSSSAMGASQPGEQKPPGAPDHWQDRRDNEDGEKRRKGRPDSGAQSTGAQPAQSLDGPSGARGQCNQSTKAASQSAMSLASAEPSRSFAPTSQLGRNATPGGPVFPALPAEESAAKRRAGASGHLRSSAVLRSVERARRQFARKKKRKAARTVRPPSLARR